MRYVLAFPRMPLREDRHNAIVVEMMLAHYRRSGCAFPPLPPLAQEPLNLLYIIVVKCSRASIARHCRVLVVCKRGIGCHRCCTVATMSRIELHSNTGAVEWEISERLHAWRGNWRGERGRRSRGKRSRLGGTSEELR